MGFVERELLRINTAIAKLDEGRDYDRLYAAQQALAWALEPTGAKSPYAMIMGIHEDSTDCLGEQDLVPS